MSCPSLGKTHRNLVAIYGGGEDGEYLFVAMEYFPGRNLAEALLDIPGIGSTVPDFSNYVRREFLEDSSFAHRDIKPENIGLSPDMKSAKLLDLGVNQAVDLSNVTDEGDQRFFIGTLQYSPPDSSFEKKSNPSKHGARSVSTNSAEPSTICSCESRCSRISRTRTHASFVPSSEKFLEWILTVIRTSGCWRRTVSRKRLASDSIL